MFVWHDYDSPVPWVEVKQALERLTFGETLQARAGTQVAFLFKAHQPDALASNGAKAVRAIRSASCGGDQLRCTRWRMSTGPSRMAARSGTMSYLPAHGNSGDRQLLCLAM